MKRKRLGALLLALALLLGLSAPALPAVGLATAAAAIPARDANDQYFGNQLREDGDARAAAAFYEALVTMYENGTLLDGGAQVVDVSGVSAKDLGNALSTARDAFYMDYPDLFYVNFNNFAVKQDGGTVSIVPGTRGQGYLLTGLDDEDGALVKSMVASYDAVLGSIVNEAKAAVPQSGESAQAAQVRTVHDALTRRITYTLDSEDDPANTPFLRTAYGLVTGKGVCEAYSRAFKSAMDALDIPCSLVEGAFRHSAEVVENHMWAQVQIGQFWYGVDVTMDDPDNDGYQIYTDYLLAGADTMDRQHALSTVMSAAGYEFAYHNLVMDNYYATTVHNDNGLKVRLDKMGVDETMAEEGGDGTGTFYVSYKGMNYTDAAKKGYYILARFLTIDPETNEWTTTQWGYLNPQYYGDAMKQTDTETALPMPHVKYAEFGVTDIAPQELDLGDVSRGEDLIAANYYQGDPSLLLATTGMQENPYGTYTAPPYIASASPSQARTLDIGKKYNVVLHFDDKLIPDPAVEGAKLGYELEAYTYIRGKYQDLSGSAEANSEISTPVLSADGRTVTFTFKPSEQWAHDNIFYTFTFTGVVGERSKKAPNTLTYLAAHPCAVCAYQSQGYDWNVYGKPQLLDDPADIEVENWTKDQLAEMSDLLKDRMTLVVTAPNGDTVDAMGEELRTETGISADKIVETYSINLTLCKAQVIKTGQAVRVMLGFPQGFEDYDKVKNATFKAYHYSKDEKGNITGVNEIDCIVTERGLLILCDSFSPFAIVAEETPGARAETEKTLVVSGGEGGSVTVGGGTHKTGKNGETVDDIYTFASWTGGSAAVTAQPGYTVESVTLGDKSIDVGDGTKPVEVPLDAIPGGTEMLAVTFAPTGHTLEQENEAVKERFKALAPAKADITADLPAKMAVAAGQSAVLKTAYTSEAGSLLQWYKDGHQLPGETGEELTVTSSGSYQAKITTFAGPYSTVAESAVCAVTVAAPAAPAATPAPAAPQPTVTPVPQATAAPTPAPAAPAPAAAAQATATPAPTPVSLGKGGPEPTAAPAPGSTTPAPALTNTPAPAMPPAAPAPQATVAPAATPEPQEKEKGGVPPLAVAGIAAAGFAVAGGLVWMFLPRRRHRR